MRQLGPSDTGDRQEQEELILEGSLQEPQDLEAEDDHFIKYSILHRDSLGAKVQCGYSPGPCLGPALPLQNSQALGLCHPLSFLLPCFPLLFPVKSVQGQLLPTAPVFLLSVFRQLTLPFPLLSSSVCLSVHLGDVLLPAPAASSGGGASACSETGGLRGQDGGSDSETSQPEKGEAVTPQMASFEVTPLFLFLLSQLPMLLPALSCWSCTFGESVTRLCRKGLLCCSKMLRVGSSMSLLLICSWVPWAEGALLCSDAPASSAGAGLQQRDDLCAKLSQGAGSICVGSDTELSSSSMSTSCAALWQTRPTLGAWCLWSAGGHQHSCKPDEGGGGSAGPWLAATALLLQDAAAATTSHAWQPKRAAVRAAAAPVARKGWFRPWQGAAGGHQCSRNMMPVGVEGRGPVFRPGHFFH